MAYLYRVGAAVLLALTALLLLLPGVAVAGTEYTTSAVGHSSGWQSSKAAACAAAVAAYNAIPEKISVASVGSTEPNCYTTYVYKNGGGSAGYFEDSYGTRTVDDPPPADAQDAYCDGQASMDQWGDVTADGKVSSGQVCSKMNNPAVPGRGCKSTFEADISYQDSAGNWKTYGKSKMISGGGSGCTPSTSQAGTSTTAPASPTVAPTPCKGYPGTVNGVEVCLPFSAAPGKTESTKTKSETSTPAGGSPTTTTTTEKTTCEGSSCTTEKTTTSSTGGGASSTSTSSTSQGKGEYCAVNKSASECGGDGKSGFGGACTAGFKCDGDALMCAIAKEQHVRNCALFETTSAESDLYDENKTKTGNQTGSETVAISSASFDQSNALGVSAQCIPDLNVTVAGAAVSLPFSDLCDYLQYFGYINLAVSFLLAMRIVARG